MAAYLSDAIESVLGQTYANWELILVDDGSTDASGDICDRYAAKDARIRVLHTQNQGALAAAIHGVMQAKHEYLVTLDGDDRLDAALLETLDRAFTEDGPDMVLYRYDCFGERSAPAEAPLYPLLQTLSPETVLAAVIGETDHALWTKAVRTELYQQAMRGEEARLRLLGRVSINADYVRAVPVVCRCQRALALPDALYHYRLIDSSLSHKFNQKHVTDLSRTTAYVLDVLADYGYAGEAWERVCYTAYLHMLATRLDALTGSDLPRYARQKLCKALQSDAVYQSAAAYETRGRGRGAFNQWELRSLTLFRRRMYGVMRLLERIKKHRSRVRTAEKAK